MRFDDMIQRFLYPWMRRDDDRPKVQPMEGVYRKSFEDGRGRKIMIFVMKDDPYCEMLFYIDGSPVYRVSFGTFEELVNGAKKAEQDFRDGFLSTFLETQYKSEKPEKYFDDDDKMKMLGYE